jgi:hypothetical protein
MTGIILEKPRCLFVGFFYDFMKIEGITIGAAAVLIVLPKLSVLPRWTVKKKKMPNIIMRIITLINLVNFLFLLFHRSSLALGGQRLRSPWWSLSNEH